MSTQDPSTCLSVTSELTTYILIHLRMCMMRQIHDDLSKVREQKSVNAHESVKQESVSLVATS